MPALQMDKEKSLSTHEVSPADVFHRRPNDENARMAELVDAVDSKSTDRNIVPVRVRLRVPFLLSTIHCYAVPFQPKNLRQELKGRFKIHR